MVIVEQAMVLEETKRAQIGCLEIIALWTLTDQYSFNASSLQAEYLLLCVQVDSMLKAYAAKFHTIKAPRKLQWRPHLGSVDLKVTVGARALELNVSPVHAAIIYHFKVGTVSMP